MAFEDVTPAYVNLLSYDKYASRTANQTEFDALKAMYSVYINTNTCHFPAKKQTHGMALLLCHHYAMDDTESPDDGGSDTTRGPIEKEKVGDVMMEYGRLWSGMNVSERNAWLSQTKWGLEFLYLMRTFKGTPLVT